MKTLRILTATVIISLLAITTTDLLAYSAAEADSVTQNQHQTDNQLFELLEKSAIHGLSSDISGVIESTLYNVVEYKVNYPMFESEELIQKISKIAVDGNNHKLQYKAYLALSYYHNQGEFGLQEEMLSLFENSNQDRIFFYLQDKVQSGQFNSNQ